MVRERLRNISVDDALAIATFLGSAALAFLLMARSIAASGLMQARAK
jgi:hypothetical protein